MLVQNFLNGFMQKASSFLAWCRAASSKGNTVKQVKLYIGLALGLLVCFAVYRWHTTAVHNAERAVHAHYAQVLNEIKLKTERADASYRALEAQTATIVKEKLNDYQAKEKQHKLDASAASNSRGRMLQRASDSRSTTLTATSSCGASVRAATSQALDLYTELLSKSSERLRVLASFADDSYEVAKFYREAYQAVVNQNSSS